MSKITKLFLVLALLGFIQNLTAQKLNTISFSFTTKKNSNNEWISYKAGDQIRVDLKIKVGVQVSVTGAKETTVQNGSNTYTLQATEDGTGVKPLVFTGDILAVDGIGFSDYLDTFEAQSEVLEKVGLKWCEVRHLKCDNLPNLQTVSAQYSSTLMTASFNNCPKLEEVNVSASPTDVKTKNGLSQVGLKGCNALKNFVCVHRNLTKINLSNYKNLEELFLSENDLVEVNVSGCDKLSQFDVSRNKITKLDITGCVSLDYFRVIVNKLSVEESHKIVEALPKKDKLKNFYFISPFNPTPKEENVMSINDVKAAAAKNWQVCLVNQYGTEPKPYNGEGATFAVTIAPTENGTIEIEGYTAEELKEVEDGTTLTVKATPNEGYDLKTLLANNVDILSNMEFTVTGDVTLTATFAKKETSDKKLLFGGVLFSNGKQGFKFLYNDENVMGRVEIINDGKVTSYDSVYYDNGKIDHLDKYLDFQHTGTPKLDTRFTYRYNDKGQLTDRIATMVSTGALFISTKFEYDDQGRLLREVSPIPNSPGYELINKYEYDSKGNLVKMSMNSKDPKGERMTNKLEYKYNAKNQLVEEIYFEPITPGKQEKDVKMNEVVKYTYDDKDCLTKMEGFSPEYSRDEDGKETYELISKGYYTYRYDEKVSNRNIFMPNYSYILDAPYSNYHIPLVGMPYKRVEQSTFAPAATKAMYVGAYIYSYPSETKKILRDKAPTVKVYPSLATDNITVESIDIKMVKIYSVNGQELKSYAIDADRIVIPVNDLTSGTYIAVVKTAKQNVSQKFVVK